MCVRLAGGMVRVSTARTRMRGARACMRSGVSKETPAGVGPKSVIDGLSEWQAAQRLSTIGRTSAKVTAWVATAEREATDWLDAVGRASSQSASTVAAIVPARVGTQRRKV